MTVIELVSVIFLLAIGIVSAIWGFKLFGFLAAAIFFCGGIGITIIVFGAIGKLSYYIHQKKLAAKRICPCGSKVFEDYESIGATERGEPITQCKCGRAFALKEDGEYYEIPL